MLEEWQQDYDYKSLTKGICHQGELQAVVSRTTTRWDGNKNPYKAAYQSWTLRS